MQEAAAAGELTESVLPLYDLALHDWISYRDNWWRLRTTKGNKWLHYETDLQTVQKRHEITEQLARAGYRRTLRFIRNRHGDPFTQVNNRYYTLVDEWEARIVMLTDADARLCGENLSRLHLALEQVNWPLELPLAHRHGKWKKRLMTACEQLYTLVSSAQVNAVRDCLTGARLAVDELSALDYEPWCQQEAGRDSLCLGDYRQAGLRITALDRVVTLELDHLAYDSKLYDLAKAILHYVEDSVVQLVPSFIAGYESCRPLSRFEKQLVMAYLAFPHAFYGLAAAGSGPISPGHLQSPVWQQAIHQHQVCLGLRSVLL